MRGALTGNQDNESTRYLSDRKEGKGRGLYSKQQVHGLAHGGTSSSMPLQIRRGGRSSMLEPRDSICLCVNAHHQSVQARRFHGEAEGRSTVGWNVYCCFAELSGCDWMDGTPQPLLWDPSTPRNARGYSKLPPLADVGAWLCLELAMALLNLPASHCAGRRRVTAVGEPWHAPEEQQRRRAHCRHACRRSALLSRTGSRRGRKIREQKIGDA